MTASRITPGFLEEEYCTAAMRYDSVLRPLDGSRILISGGTGPFGRWILGVAKASQNCNGTHIGFDLVTRDVVTAQARLGDLLDGLDIRFLEGDIRSVDLSQSTAPYVIHGAAPSSLETFNGQGSLEKFDTLVSGTRRMSQHAVKVGARKFLFLSSGAVYGSVDDAAPLSEDQLFPIGTELKDAGLMQGKRAAEFVAFETCRQANIPCVAARCFSFVGAGIPYKEHYAIGEFTQKSLLGEPIVINSDGSQLRSYMYLGDLSGWLFTLLAKNTRDTIYNVGSDDSISIYNLASRIRSVVGAPDKIQCLRRSAVSVGNPQRNNYVPNISRFIDELRPPNLINLEQALSAYVRWVSYLSIQT